MTRFWFLSCPAARQDEGTKQDRTKNLVLCSPLVRRDLSTSPSFHTIDDYSREKRSQLLSSDVLKKICNNEYPHVVYFFNRCTDDGFPSQCISLSSHRHCSSTREALPSLISLLTFSKSTFIDVFSQNSFFFLQKLFHRREKKFFIISHHCAQKLKKIILPKKQRFLSKS